MSFRNSEVSSESLFLEDVTAGSNRRTPKSSKQRAYWCPLDPLEFFVSWLITFIWTNALRPNPDITGIPRKAKTRTTLELEQRKFLSPPGAK